MAIPKKILNIILIVINVINVILGLVFVVAGAALKTIIKAAGIDLEELAKEVPEIAGGLGSGEVESVDVDSFLTPIMKLLIGIGVVFLSMGITGLVGSCCKQNIFMMVYAGLMAVVVIGDLVVLGLVAGSFIPNKVKSYMKETMRDEYEGIDDFSRDPLIMTAIMIYKKCCGVHNYEIFNSSTVFKRERTVEKEIEGQQVGASVTLVTPMACCKMEGGFPSVTPLDETCAFEPTEENNNYKIGCFPLVKDDIESKKGMLIAAVLFKLFGAIVCLILAGLIIKAEKDNGQVANSSEA